MAVNPMDSGEWNAQQLLDERLLHLALAQAKIEEADKPGLLTAAAFLELDEIDPAVEAYLLAWSRDQALDALPALSRILSDREDWKTLFRVLREALDTGIDIPTLRLMACYYSDTDNPERAVATFHEAIDAGDDEAWLCLALHLSEIDGDRHLASSAFERALAVGDRKANWGFSRLLLMLGDTQGAILRARAAVLEGWTGALVPLGQGYAQTGEYDLAEAAFLDAIDDEVHQAEVAYLDFLISRGRFDDARRLFREVEQQLDKDDAAYIANHLGKS